MVKEKKRKNLLNSAQYSKTKKEKTVEATPLHTLLTHSLQRCIQKILMNSIKKIHINKKYNK